MDVTCGVEGVPAPALEEVAQVWWDVEREPVVCWDDEGRRFVLVDPGDPGNVLVLADLAAPADDPAAVAAVLAEGLAACDFPPSGERAAERRVAATLRAAGRSEVVTER